MDLWYPLAFLALLIILMYFLVRRAIALVKAVMPNKSPASDAPTDPLIQKYQELAQQNLSPEERDKKMLQFLKEQKQQEAVKKPAKPNAQKPLPEPIKAIAIRRLRRDDEQRWREAKSWIGGKPTLAPGRWPTYSDTYDGYYCVAQINITDLPKGDWLQDLPDTGALIFFADIHEQGGTIVYEPAPETQPLHEPPAGLEPLNTGTGLLRQWPIEFVTVKDWPAQAIHDAEAYDQIDQYNSKRLGLAPQSVHIDLPDEPGGPGNMDRQDAVKNKLAGSDEAFASLDQTYRDKLMQENQLPAFGRRHQMFGHGDVFQNEDTEFADHVLLLQINSDHMIANFGDATAVQFWIKPEDLKAGNWDACTVSIA